MAGDERLDVKPTTVEEFEAQYAARSGVTVEYLHLVGRRGAPCECGDALCDGFAMLHADEDLPSVGVLFLTHWQAMACLNCGLAGQTPESHFPLPPGLWAEPCPECGARAVWITETRTR